MGLFLVQMEFFLVIRLCRVECCRRVVSGDTVFSDQRSDVCIRVFIEKAVVPYTQTNHDVQVRLGIVEQPGLPG